MPASERQWLEVRKWPLGAVRQGEPMGGAWDVAIDEAREVARGTVIDEVTDEARGAAIDDTDAAARGAAIDDTGAAARGAARGASRVAQRRATVSVVDFRGLVGRE